MKRFLHLLATILVTMSGMAVAQAQPMAGPNPEIPTDTAVHTGRLANGLTYYVRYNNYPKNHVNFYIAQRVGSVQEEESQRGLAHFLEHMAFNGSDNFKGNGIIDYTRQLGVEFGRDLNAYTSTDRTVYNINDVPSTRQSALDSCLLILRDWSCGLLLEDEEIDKERGVIHEEWRARSSASQRMLNRSLETLFPGSKYGKRMPIGLMSVVDNFKYKELRDYYQKWYYPTNQAIIVVGDVDVAYTIAKIKEIFEPIAVPANAGVVTDEPVPDNAKPIIVVEKDKEQQYPIVQLMFKHDPTPVAEKKQITYLLQQYADNVVIQMLNQRLAEKALDADCPFKVAGAYNSRYLGMAKTKDAFSVFMIPKDGQTAEALKASAEEVYRVAQHGFTATELARASEEYLSQLEKSYNTRDQINNDTWASDLTENFLQGEPLPSLELLNMVMPQMAKAVNVDIINEYFSHMVSHNDSNIVVLNYNHEEEGTVYPTVAQLSSALEAARTAKLDAYVDNVKNEPLITELPVKGKIVKETTSEKFDYKQLTLSNGATVILKKTDFKADEIKLRAEQRHGFSNGTPADFANHAVYNVALSVSGLGNFDNTELTKALAGKQVSVSLSGSDSYDRLNGQSTVKDLETMFQLIYLNMTSIKKDQKNFDNLMNQLESVYKNWNLNPDYVYRDSVNYILDNRSWRSQPFGIDNLKQVSYDRILEMAKESTANAAGWTFYFVGNFDETVIKPLIEQYIASLPNTGKKPEFKEWAEHPTKPVVSRFTRKMETPKAKSTMTWYNTTAPCNVENTVYAKVAGNVIDRLYLQKIREEASAAYSPGGYGRCVLEGSRPYIAVVGRATMNPEKSDLCLQLMKWLGEGVAQSVDEAAVADIKNTMLKDTEQQARENSYWLNVLSMWVGWGIDTHSTMKDVINGITAAKVSKWFADTMLRNGNMVEVTMTPAE